MLRLLHRSSFFLFTFIFFQLLSDSRGADLLRDVSEWIKKKRGPSANSSESDNSKAGHSDRKALPPDWTSPRWKTVQYAICDETYEISLDGFTRFDITYQSSPCRHAFLGSIIDECTVGVICDGTLSFECGTGYFKLTDGTIGRMETCGSFTFSNTPRKARNTGRDIYVDYQAGSEAICAAFCIEDIPRRENHVLEAARLLRDRNFGGFPLDGPCKCGERMDFEGRVAGGNDAQKFEFPWLGGLVVKNPIIKRVPLCGATLISDSHAISAAHCFRAYFATVDNLQLIFHVQVMDKAWNDGSWTEGQVSGTPGWNLPTETDESEETVRVDLEEIIIHPLYNFLTFDFDVAILKFKTKINFKTGKVLPLCLPLVIDDNKYKDTDKFVLAGWGKADDNLPVINRLLQKLDSPFINRETCEFHSSPTKRHFCAGYLTGGKGACSGDSGGPLIKEFANRKNQYYLAGIVSAGGNCKSKNTPSLYTNVQEVIQWIYFNVADGSANWCRRP